ncbi:protein kinase [Oscillibacter valericigenes]|nr:protein kinase [Oscillibacter valericigenes]
MDKLVHDDKGNAFTLSTCLGEGGQGVVFRVKRNTGHGLAVKALIDPVSGDILQDHSAYKKYMRKLNQIMALPQVAHIAVPLAPLHAPYCGYVMRLMECMEPLSEYLRPNSDIRATLCRKGGLSKRYEILKNLSAILCDLHSLGIVYGDLAPGNIYISANDKDCEVWLIDLDNLAYATEVSSSIGTPLYRAPEIVKGKANSLETDCYSFALLAYELLTFSKPFNGSIMDEDPVDDFSDDIYERIESGKCQYVHEPDSTNIPKYGISRQLELIMTPELETLFLQTFNLDGRSHPSHRPSMRSWYKVFQEASNCLIECEKGHAHFGNSCFLCPEEDQSVSRRRFYSLKGYLSVYALLSPENSEDADSFEVVKARSQVYEKRFSNNKTEKKQDSITIQIPWYVFDPRKKSHYDTAAFELTLNKYGCNVERVFNPELHVDLIQNAAWPDMNGLKLKATYKDRVFEFEMTKDE